MKLFLIRTSKGNVGQNLLSGGIQICAFNYMQILPQKKGKEKNCRQLLKPHDIHAERFGVKCTDSTTFFGMHKTEGLISG